MLSKSVALILGTGVLVMTFGSTPKNPVPPTCPADKAFFNVPGVRAGGTKPQIILAQDVDWPPYAYLAMPPEGAYTVAGFGHDVAVGLQSVCDIEVTVTQADWSGCWSDDKIGVDAKMGVYHGCMTYTHTLGSRPRWMEFSHAILYNNKPAGLLTRLEDGKPVVSPTSNLNGLKVVDVNGWAPTADGLAVSKNVCSNNDYFGGYEWVQPSEETKAAYTNENDIALAALLKGEADVMWVYADQAATYDCENLKKADTDTSTWDCDLWSGLGEKFAYIQTGLFETSFNGTTLTMAKKGAKIADLVNPCIDKFLKTEDYYKICEKHGFVDSCYKNDFFPGGIPETSSWELPTNEQPDGCLDGYCSC